MKYNKNGFQFHQLYISKPYFEMDEPIPCGRNI